jgi:hypothetical protein
MSDDAIAENPLFSNNLVYQLPYAGKVQAGINYAPGPRLLDLYLPEQKVGPTPVVVLLTGFPDPDFEALTGSKLMQLQAYQDWAKLLAASGIAAVIYSNLEPREDAFLLLDFLRTEASQLGIDPERVAIWSCSGNVPNALHVLNTDSSIRCAVFLYGFMLDSADSDIVAKTAKSTGFVNPNKGMQDFPENTPMLIIRAGKDDLPGVNESIDNFQAEGIARNSPISVIRFNEGVHGFDVLDDSRRSIEMIKLCVEFLRLRLSVY